MINASRLLEILAPQRFQLAWERWSGRQFNFDFVRSSLANGVFEHIEIDSQGKRGEAVFCRVWVSPLKGHRVHIKPSPDVDEPLLEICDCLPDRAYSLIECASAARSWELRVGSIAPPRVSNLAQKHAQEIADQTEAPRRAAVQYVDRIRQISDEPVMQYLANQLRSRATPDQEHEASRLGELARVPPLNDVNDAIECAAIAIALFGPVVDGEHGGFRGESPSRNQGLRLRLHITADRLRTGLPTWHGCRELPSR